MPVTDELIGMEPTSSRVSRTMASNSRSSVAIDYDNKYTWLSRTEVTRDFLISSSMSDGSWRCSSARYATLSTQSLLH